VPLRCTQKSAIRMAITIGSTSPEKAGAAIASPSTAPSTVTAGVIIESP